MAVFMSYEEQGGVGELRKTIKKEEEVVKSQSPPPTQMFYSFKRCTAERAHVFLQKSNIRLRVINRQLCIKERTDTKMRFCTIFIHRGKWRLAMKKLSFSEEQFGGK